LLRLKTENGVQRFSTPTDSCKYMEHDRSRTSKRSFNQWRSSWTLGYWDVNGPQILVKLWLVRDQQP